MDQELFKVIVRESGKTYRIFADGRIEGFPDGCLIFNRYPQFLTSALVTQAIINRRGLLAALAGLPVLEP